MSAATLLVEVEGLGSRQRPTPSHLLSQTFSGKEDSAEKNRGGSGERQESIAKLLNSLCPPCPSDAEPVDSFPYAPLPTTGEHAYAMVGRARHCQGSGEDQGLGKGLESI